jgi:CHAT domain-containing protein/Tfp pilus assembly protein PilF
MPTNWYSTRNKSGLRSILTLTFLTLISALALFPEVAFTLAQTAAGPHKVPSCMNIPPGVVIESVAKNSEAEKGGLAEGDVIVGWTRGDSKGEIRSPFDFSQVEIEEGPKGQVALEGMRDNAAHGWIVGMGRWGGSVRPNVPEALLAIYREGQELSKSNRVTEAIERWRADANESSDSQCPWLSSWFLSHAAAEAARTLQWKEADALYQAALDHASPETAEVRATLLRAWSRTFQQRNDWPSAQKYEMQALDENRKVRPESLTVARSLTNLGRLFYLTGDVAASQKYHQQALAIRQSLAPGSLDVAASLSWLADVTHEQGDLSKAESYGLQALAIESKLAPGTSEEAQTKSSLAYIASDRGDLAKAERWEREALAINQKLDPDGPAVAKSLNSLGIIAARRGDLDGAGEYWHQALVIREKIAPGGLEVAWTLGNLGLMNLRRGDLDKAQDYFQQDLAIEEKISPDSLDTAKILNNLGLLAGNRGDLAKAEEYYRRALVIKQRLGPNSLDVANSIQNLSEVAHARGDLARVDDYGRQALAIRERLAPDSVEMAASLNDLGNFASNRGELNRAEDYLQRALAILEKAAAGSLDLASVQSDLGIVAAQNGNNAKADEYNLRALVIETKSAPDSLQMAETLDNLGSVALDRGDRAQSEEYIRRELAIRKRLAPESAGYAEALAKLARILCEKQQTDEAARFYGEAIDVLDRQLARLGGSIEARAKFRAKHSDYYSEYASLLVEQGKPEIAFAVLERSRARTLLEMLAEAHVDVRQGVDPTLIEKERLLQAILTAKTNRKVDLLEGEHTPEQLASMNREMDAALSAYQELEGQIRTNSPKYAALTQPKSLNASEAQHLLDPQTILLYYALGAQRSFVFVVTPTSLNWHELAKRTEIEKTAREAYDLLTSRNRWIKGETSAQRTVRERNDEAEYEKTFVTLSQMVLGPAVKSLAGRRLIIVGDGALQYVPFAALPIPASDGSKTTVPLVAEHELVNLPSVSVLAFLRQQAKDRGTQPSKEVAILADPVFDKNDPRVSKARTPPSLRPERPASRAVSESAEYLSRSVQDVSQSGAALSRLAFSRREALAIMSVADPAASIAALDFQANRETALSKDLSQYRIVHFATHGLLDNEHPELSGLVLSLVDPEGNTRDGFVDLQDVYNLTIPADLVVLSSCETGLGKEISGEGLVGLTRGFMYAGTSRVVASLWKVDDVATSELMAAFYKGMLHAGLRPAAALRQAQMEMQKRKKWADPYYWAAFTLQGEWM